MEVVEPVVVEPVCAEPTLLYSDVVYNEICTADAPCGRCMGECDSDAHCAEGLVCF